MSVAGAAAAAPLAAVPDHVVPIAIAASAGASFAGVVATFHAANIAGLESTIDWGDGHNGAGTITSSGDQAYQIWGTNTFAQPGSYTIVITIGANQPNPAKVQTTALVLPANWIQAAGSSQPMTVAMSGNFIVVNVSASVINVSPNTAFYTVSAGVVIMAPPLIGNTPVPVQAIGSPYQVVVIGPVQVSPSDYVPWFSIREQALNAPLAVPTAGMPSKDLGDLVAAGTANDRADFNAHAPSQVTHVVMPNWLGPAALALATIFTSAEPPAKTGPAVYSFVIATTGLADDAADSNLAVQEGSEDIYHVPLYRVAARGEFGAFSGSPLSPSAALLSVSSPVPGAISPDARERIGEESLPQDSPRQESRAGSGNHMLQMVTTWIVCQVLHSTLFQQGTSLPTRPLLNRLAKLAKSDT